MPIQHKRKKSAIGLRRLGPWLVVAAILVAMIVIRNHPDSPPASQIATPPATYDVAMQELADYRVEEAERVLKQVLAAHPDSVRVRDELRWMYFNQFRPRELEALLEDGLRFRPDDFSLAVALLMSEFRPQNPREVLGYWERAADRQPEQPHVLVTLGYCHARVGNTDQAERAFQAAANLAPRDTLVRIRVAEFLIDRGDWSAAHQILNGADGEPSSNSHDEIYQDQICWLQSLIEESQDHLAAALEHIDRSLTRNPMELRYLQRRGMLLRRLGRNDDAAACYARANQLESSIGRLTEIVLSGDLESPTTALCHEIAELCDGRGKAFQAATWKRAAMYAGS